MKNLTNQQLRSILLNEYGIDAPRAKKATLITLLKKAKGVGKKHSDLRRGIHPSALFVALSTVLLIGLLLGSSMGAL